MSEGTPAVGRSAERGGALVRFKDTLKHGAHAALAPLVRALGWIGLGPDALTVIGLLLSVVAGLSFFEGGFRLGSVMLILAGLCDILDGEVARTQQRVSKFGAFLDSTLDRLGEALVLAGIAGFYLTHMVELARDPHLVIRELGRGLEPEVWARMALVSILALVGSFMVSYTRARAEGLGLECRVGWFERPERLVLLIIAGLFGVGRVMVVALLILTVASFVTAGQRVVHVWRITRSR